MDSVSLQCFIALAESGSFTRAAERVSRTQSAVSQQIAKLENQLGTTLLSRGRHITLTPEGEVFLDYARRIFALQREAVDRFKLPQLAGEVRFGLPEDFASVLLADVLQDFVRLHPRILVNTVCDLTLNLFDRFQQGEFDLVLVKMSRPENFPNGQVVWTEPLAWVGDPELLNGSHRIPLILAPQPCVYRANALQALQKAGLRWRLAFSSPSYAGTIAAVKAGMGITVLPGNMIPPQLKAIRSSKLPKLQDTHVSLIKLHSDNPVINSLEEFVFNKLTK